jgi:hypothetical protein
MTPSTIVLRLERFMEERFQFVLVVLARRGLFGALARAKNGVRRETVEKCKQQLSVNGLTSIINIGSFFSFDSSPAEVNENYKFHSAH